MVEKNVWFLVSYERINYCYDLNDLRLTDSIFILLYKSAYPGEMNNNNFATKAQRHKENTMNFFPLSKEEEKIASEIVDAAYSVHKNLGPGLLERIYETCLCHEL